MPIKKTLKIYTVFYYTLLENKSLKDNITKYPFKCIYKIEPGRWRITNNQMLQSHQTGNKKTEKPHNSKRCLFLPNKERNKKPRQMPILIVSKVKQFINTPKWWFYLLVCLFVYLECYSTEYINWTKAFLYLELLPSCHFTTCH